MLAAADLERTQKLFWEEFWDFLWGRTSNPGSVPLRSTYSEQRLRTYLDDIAERYDQNPVPARPIAGTTNFEAGQAGLSLDADGAVLLIENALRSLQNRAVELPLMRTDPTAPVDAQSGNLAPTNFTGIRVRWDCRSLPAGFTNSPGAAFWIPAR